MVISTVEKMKRRYPILRKRELEVYVMNFGNEEVIEFNVKWNHNNVWTIVERMIDGKKCIVVDSKHYHETFHTYKAVNQFLKDKIKL